MTNENFHFRQTDIFNPKTQKYKIHVLGCGALGSWITLCLAKTGFDDLTIYDFDVVEDLNIGSQLYRVKDLDNLKTLALKEIIKEFVDLDIKTIEGEVTDKTVLDMSLNNIFILTFDTLKCRELVFNLLKDYNCIVIDARMGGEEYNIQVVNTSDKEQIKKWEESFNIIFSDLPCNAKAISYCNMSVASEITNIIKKINNNELYPTKLLRHMKIYKIINNQHI